MGNLQKGFIVPLVIAIVAVLVVGGGIYYSKNKTETSQLTDSSNDNSSVLTQDVFNETSGWKTHTNTTIGFSFKYPSNLYIQDDLTTREGTGILNITNYNVPPYPEPLPTDFFGIQIQYHTKLLSESLKDIASRPNELGGGIPKVEYVIIAGLDAIKSNATGDAMYYLPKSKTEYMLIMAASRILDGQAGKIAPKILSTLKFTN